MRYVVIDPDGSDHSYLGLLVRYATGVSYRQQCGGVACDQRSVEGYYVPLGGARYDAEGRVDPGALTAVPGVSFQSMALLWQA